MRDGRAGRGELAWLALVVAAGTALRSYRLGWGLPEYAFPDGTMYFVRPAARLVALGQWVPDHFVHPPLLVYVNGLLFALWGLVTGETVAAGGSALQAQLATLTLLGRAASVALSGLAVVLLWALGRRLVGGRAALLAAAAFALAPLQVLEAHRVNPDAPLLVMILLTALTAVAALERRRPDLLFVAFLLAGIAGGFKYSGPAAAAVPAWAALVWPQAPWGRRLAWLAAGGALTAGGLALACFAVFFDFQRAWSTFAAVVEYSYVIGMPGVDRYGTSWVHAPYLFPSVVSLPYMLGWPLYAAAVAGLALLVRARPRAAAPVLAFVLPYFAIMGGAAAIVARYYLPLAPFLALGAGVALERALRGSGARGALGAAAVAGVLGYTLAVSLSQCRRLDLGPQRQAAALVAEAAAGRAKLTVAYPNMLVLHYDAVRPFLRAVPAVAMTYFPGEYQNVRRDRGEPPPDDELRARTRGWLEAQEVGAVVLPGWIEHGVVRERPDGLIARFYRQLADGSVGFRLAGHFRTRFWTQPLYTWADPMLETHWETGISGYKVFLREETATAEGRAGG